MSHQIFGAQYLKTAFVLPQLFNQAKLEWLLHEPRREKIQSPKNLYFRTGHLTLDRINQATDNIIRDQKKYVKGVDCLILVINIVMMLCIGTISVCYVSDDLYNYYDKSYPILLTIISSTLRLLEFNWSSRWHLLGTVEYSPVLLSCVRFERLFFVKLYPLWKIYRGFVLCYL